MLHVNWKHEQRGIKPFLRKAEILGTEPIQASVWSGARRMLNFSWALQMLAWPQKDVHCRSPDSAELCHFAKRSVLMQSAS